MPPEVATPPEEASPPPAASPSLASRRSLGWTAAAAVVAITAAAFVGHSSKSNVPARADAVPADLRSPVSPTGPTERVIVQLDRPALGGLPEPPTGSAADLYVASLHAEANALRGALSHRGVKFEDVLPFGRVFNGFAATVPADDLAKLPSLGVKVSPVRRFYPASSIVLPQDKGSDSGDVAPTSGKGMAVLDTGSRSPLMSLVPGAEPVAVARARPQPGQAAPDVYATTDEVLAGLERATAEHDRVALVGVSAPYAGFDDSPEAQAASAAAHLGTLVVAPAGNEDGPVGSPGGAPSALTVGAIGGSALPVVETPFGVGTLLGGDLKSRPIKTASYQPGARGLYDKQGRSRVRGRAAILRRGLDVTQQVQQAAAAGAVAAFVADPKGSAPFPAIATERTRIPAVGLVGGVAREALDSKSGLVTVGSTNIPAPTVKGTAAPYSASGGYGAAKPDVLGPATARTPDGLVAGTAVAAVQGALAALALSRHEPGATADALAAGIADEPPHPLVRAKARRTAASPAELGPLALQREGGAVNGVAFSVGAVQAGVPGRTPTRVAPATRLVLQLLDAQGAVVRTLTPPGGALDLLPGRYSYTLPRSALRSLHGPFRFRVRAWGVGTEAPSAQDSAAFGP